jgi:Domain of unknown function (DUF5134)
LIGDLALRWAVTVLFGASMAGQAYVLVAQRERWICTVERLLHLVMSAAMLVMAWPVGTGLPTLGPIIFFLAATIWFLLVAARVFSSTAGRLTNGYHAIMMAAVAWLYAAVSDGLPGQPSHLPDRTTSKSSGMEMPGMDISVPEPVWITVVDWIATVGFASAAVYWLYRYSAQRRTSQLLNIDHPADLGPLYQAFMASGMAIMFGVML